MRARQAKTAYQWADATARLQSIRNAIALQETRLHGQEWAVSKTKAKLEKLERDRAKVTSGLVQRP